jgi:tRNA threonylcarbamoyladenosine biosynthesis protein TsaE
MDQYLQSSTATDAFGRRLAEALQDNKRLLVTLEGELGAGKTSLVRAFLHGLGHTGRVRSPTYTLMEPYSLAGKQIIHLDLYRLGDPGELEFLGFRDLIDEDHIVLIEWPERAGDLIPPADLVITLSYEGEGRRIHIRAGSDRGKRLISRLPSGE